MMTIPRIMHASAFAITLLDIAVLPAFAADGNFRTVAQLAVPTTAPPSVPTGIMQQGPFLTAPIVLDGVTLFRIAVPLNSSVSQLPIDARVAQVQTALAQLIVEDGSGRQAKPVFDYRTLRVHTRRVGDAVVLEAVDGKHPDPLPIVTVTSVDGRANSTNVQVLATEWQVALQSAVVRALVLRQPGVEKASAQSVIRLAAVLLAVSLIVALALRDLRGRMERLETEVAARNAAAESESAMAPEKAGATQERRRFFALQLRTLKPAQRLGLLRATAETLLWGIALSWFLAATWSLSLFAETTPLAQTIAHATFGVVTTIVLAILVNRLLDALIARTAHGWRLRSLSSSEDRARSLLRVPTIARIVAGGKSFVVAFTAALLILGQVGVPIGSVVTIGGLAAIALSLAAQNFVRDFLNGFLVLLEDQYVVGDFVTINTFSGLVERLTLRMVQIRDLAGDLITVPHSSVTSVVNQSRNWSRVDYRVPIDPDSDIPKAIEIVRAQIAALASEDDWMDHFREPVEWIGIDGLSRDWVVLRASVRTAPLRQFELRRQINERVLAAFGVAGIRLGAPPLFETRA